tara:strand:- start:480 stop:1328 length:849 start_codon:yes stop_codon:yes gene_type:complete
MQKQSEQKLLMQKIEKECAVDTSLKMEYPPVALSLGKKTLRTKNGQLTLPIPIGTYGNFSFVQSPPKTKKTFFISLLSSVYLSRSNNFGGDIKGHRSNQCLLHIDTEQGAWHAQRVFKRAIDMSNIDGTQCYYTYALRQIGFKQRIDFIEYLLKNKIRNTGLVIIDGIADLVGDVNNLEESNACVQKLMEWSSIYGCHIITVIHSNYGSSKPTGHLGSLLEKKCETQIELEANTVNKGWTTVKCKRSRGYAFETFSFKINDLGLPEVVGDLYDPLKENGKRY